MDMADSSGKRINWIGWSLPLFLVAAMAPPSWGAVTGTARVSVRSGGAQGARDSYAPSVSADGGFVGFDTRSALVPSDTNGVSDVFLRSLTGGKTTRVSSRSGGGQANGGSFDATVSGGGRFVAFDSDASNLVPYDVNGATDIFVRNRVRSNTRRISVSTRGRQANGDSYDPAISEDGRFVAFSSYASNLVWRDTNHLGDIFVRDRSLSRTRRVSVSTSGHQADGASFDAAISGDGRSVAFDSLATNLVQADTNGVSDVFVRRGGRTVRASMNSKGIQGHRPSGSPSLSSDGRLVAFTSYAPNLVPGDTNHVPDVFVRDLSTRRTIRVSVGQGGTQADGASFDPVISADGRFVAFQSMAANLVPGDTQGYSDVFVRDLEARTTVRVGVGSLGSEGNAGSFRPSLSADGAVVAFESDASNLVAGDTNDARDVFARGAG
jgi:Tol biopolymer transport system component